MFKRGVMWFECSRLLSLGLAEYREHRMLSPDLMTVFAKWESEPVLQRPRPPVLARLGSPVAFAIGKEFLASGGISPEEFAKELLPVLERISLASIGANAIHFSVESGGFLNINFADSAAFDLIEKLALDEDPFDFRSVFTASRTAKFPPDTFVFSSGDSRIRSRAAELDDEAVSELLARPDSPEVRLMLLGVLADPELDASIFLSGLNGTQNLPWLLERFMRDVVSVRSQLLVSPQPTSGESVSVPPLLEQFAYDLKEELVWARLEFAAAARHGRSEELLRYLLRLSRVFYRFYNTPGCRSELSRLREVPVKITSSLHFLELVLNRSLSALLSIQV